MTDIVITGRKISAEAIIKKWPGSIVACKHDKVSGDTTVEWHADSPVTIKTPVEIGTAQDEYDAYLADPTAVKTTKASSGLNTVQNKTILDAIWEIHKAVRGVIQLPTETKAQYADRLKTMWAGNEP